MSIPLPDIPQTGKVGDGANNFNTDRARINMVFTGPAEPPHLVNRVWIRPQQ